MTRPLLVLAVLSSLACTEAAPDVYWLELTPDDRPCADPALEENFVLSRGIDDIDGVGTLEQSGAAGYALVTRAADGTVLVNFDDHVLTGAENADGALDVAWAGFDVLSDGASEPGYAFTSRESVDVEETLTLRPPSADDKPWSGIWTVSTAIAWEYVETDEWSAEGGFGQIPSFLLLEATTDELPPGNRNLPDRDDCEGDECRITVSDECVESYAVSAARIDDVDPREIDVLAGFGREPGSGQPVGPASPF